MTRNIIFLFAEAMAPMRQERLVVRPSTTAGRLRVLCKASVPLMPSSALHLCTRLLITHANSSMPLPLYALCPLAPLCQATAHTPICHRAIIGPSATAANDMQRRPSWRCLELKAGHEKQTWMASLPTVRV